MLTPETQFVLICSRTELTNEIISHLESIAVENLNWRKILSLSAYHGTAPLLYQALNNLNFNQGIIPETILINLKNLYYANLGRTTKLWHKFCQIYDAFKKQNIELIPLKGIILGRFLYHNPALRPIYADIDILIKERDLAVATQELIKIGYTPKADKAGPTKTFINFTKDRLIVELHQIFLPFWLNRIKTESLWERAEIQVMDKREIKVLSIEDQVLTLSLQMRHDWPYFRLFRLCDINELLSQYKDCLDWGYLLKAAKEYRLQATLYFSLYLCQQLLSASLPEDIFHKFSSPFIKLKLLPLFSRKELELLSNSDLKYGARRKTDALFKALLNDSLIDCLKIALHNKIFKRSRPIYS